MVLFITDLSYYFSGYVNYNQYTFTTTAMLYRIFISSISLRFTSLSKMDWIEFKPTTNSREVMYGALCGHRELYHTGQRQHWIAHFRMANKCKLHYQTFVINFKRCIRIKGCFRQYRTWRGSCMAVLLKVATADRDHLTNC